MSNRNMVSLCQYPTTTVLIDDSEDFIEQTSELLTKQKIPSRYFSDPGKALDFINQEYKADPFTNRCISVTPDRDADSYATQLDIRKIHHEIYNPDRFTQNAVLCVDYAMPQKNGLEICREAKDSFCLKLILTGEASHKLAVDAFNEGSIDKFLQKGEAHLPDLLIKDIRELQNKYFLRLSDSALSRSTEKLNKQIPAFLRDPAFAKLLNDICAKHSIIEYYLLDEHGSFLLLDINATPSWLIVKSENDMHGIVDFARDHNPPKEIMDALEHRTLVPYFHTESDWKIGYEDKECREYLYPATKITGHQNYYYSYVKNPDAYKLDRNNILSFAKYLATQK